MLRLPVALLLLVLLPLTLLLALVVWEAANAAIARHLDQLSANAATARSARVRTLLPMLRTVLGIVVTIFITLNVLAEIGVNVAPLLAGAGVLGLAVGFGSQTLVRDVITGIFLLFEDAVAVGDTVTVGGLSGTVEQLSEDRIVITITRSDSDDDETRVMSVAGFGARWDDTSLQELLA
jgi:small-conductance mechanosensitive channel